ncbi:MAG: enoyl-CoA hydratase/isomerase family protein [Candidatus Tectomicrobia bacterium]|nr:enoyl-CoA hydratase/isomerase family protein [Candidatus Tectomicrobia bacterium]
MSDTVLSDLSNGVRLITLNRPAVLNAMNAELVGALADAFQAANADPETRVIIFTGAGKAFCAGADLKERRDGISPEQARANTERVQQVTREMVLGDRLIIGAINGWAVGGGFEWAIGCDLSIWAESAQAFFPEVEWGLFVTGGATAILPALIGPAKTKEMMLLGKRYSAAELLELGVAWRVAPDHQLMSEAQAVASRIASLPERAVRDMKTVLNKATYADVEMAIALETEAAVRGSTDPATAERIAMFGQSG